MNILDTQLSLSLVCIESLYWRLDVLPMDQHLKTSMNWSNVKNSDQSSSTMKQQTGNITGLIMGWTLLCPEWGTNSLSHDCMSMCVETKSYTLYCQKYFYYFTYYIIIRVFACLPSLTVFMAHALFTGVKSCWNRKGPPLTHRKCAVLLPAFRP